MVDITESVRKNVAVALSTEMLTLEAPAHFQNKTNFNIFLLNF